MEPVSFGTAIANSVMLLFGFLSSERQRSLKERHFKALQLVDDLKALKYPKWSTVRLIKARKELMNFSLAFLKELYEQMKETHATPN